MTRPTQTFEIRAAIDPQTLPRIIGQLARRWVTPMSLASEQIDGTIRVRFVTHELTPDAAEMVAETLRSNVLVHDVALTA